MTVQDREGMVLTGVTPQSRDRYEQGRDLFVCYVGDPQAEADAAIAASPAFAIAKHARPASEALFKRAPSLPVAV
jgi:hypothetical protein